jgi:3-oxoacyl-[acyl-carrier-protein] synthase-3
MKKTVIKGTGRYVPPRLVTNDDLSEWMDTSNEWIVQRTGIQQRYWVPEEGGVGVSDLGWEPQRKPWRVPDGNLKTLT